MRTGKGYGPLFAVGPLLLFLFLLLHPSPKRPSPHVRQAPSSPLAVSGRAPLLLRDPLLALGANEAGSLGVGQTEAQLGQTATPLEVSGLGEGPKAVGAGPRHVVVVVEGGGVYGFGSAQGGALGNGLGEGEVDAPAPVCAPEGEGVCPEGPFLGGAVGAAAGEGFSLVLLASGEVLSFGENSEGRLGTGRPQAALPTSTRPVAVKLPEAATAVAAGRNFGLALLKDGRIFAWGSNKRGQLGAGQPPSALPSAATPVEVGSLPEPAVGVAAGGEFGLALLKGGAVYGWGEGRFGQLGGEAGEESQTPLPIPGLPPIAQLAAGERFVLALSQSGALFAWGANGAGELGVGESEGPERCAGGPCSRHPLQPPALSFAQLKAVAAGGAEGAALLEEAQSGTVALWGADRFGQLGGATPRESCSGEEPSVPCRTTPTLLPSVAGTALLAVGPAATYLGVDPPTPVVGAVSPNEGSNFGTNKVTISGRNLSGATAVHFGTVAAPSFEVVSPTTVVAVAPSGSGTVPLTVTTPDGTSPSAGAPTYTFRAAGPPSGWGENNEGELGEGVSGEAYDRKQPVEVVGLYHLTALAAGGATSAALMNSGTVWTFGSNSEGQLGDGKSPQEQPFATKGVELKGLPETPTAIALGNNFGLALLKNGHVYAWGSNRSGQLGSGKSAAELPFSTTPVEVGPLPEPAVEVVAGGEFGLALLKGGAVYSWGLNNGGALGSGKGAAELPSSPTPLPVLLPEGAEAFEIAAGASHALALLKGGAVVAWGEGGEGQLGDGATASSPQPVAVKGLSLGQATAVGAGGNFSLALLANGQLVSFGSNRYGQLGLGEGSPLERCGEAATPCATVPHLVANLSGVQAVRAGNNFALALLANGHAVSFGENGVGQLGLATRNGPQSCSARPCATAPVTVADLTETALLAAGGNHALALAAAPTPPIWRVLPNLGPLRGGTRVKVEGDHFLGATRLLFGTTPATSFEVVNEDLIYATAPPFTAAQTVQLEVGTEGGGTPGSANSLYGVGVWPTYLETVATGEPPTDVTASEGEPLWLSQWLGNAVEEVKPNGELLRRLKSVGGACKAKLEGPFGLAVTSAGDLWLVDSGANRLLELNGEGSCLAEVGGSGEGPGQFTHPTALTVGPEGDLYVADTGNARIAVFSPSGQYLRSFGSFGSGPGQLEWPLGLAFSPLTHDLYVADTFANRLSIFTPAGAYVGQIPAKSPRGVAFDGAGNIFVPLLFEGQVEELNSAYEPVTEFYAPTEGTPGGIAVRGEELFLALTSGRRPGIGHFSGVP